MTSSAQQIKLSPPVPRQPKATWLGLFKVRYCADTSLHMPSTNNSLSVGVMLHVESPS